MRPQVEQKEKAEPRKEPERLTPSREEPKRAATDPKKPETPLRFFAREEKGQRAAAPESFAKIGQNTPLPLPVKKQGWLQRQKGWLILAAVLVLLLLAGLALEKAPFLRAQKASVSGISYVDATAVDGIARKAFGKPLYRVPTSALEEEIAKVPGVKAASVTRSWPDSLRVEVSERKPAAVVEHPGAEATVIDETGVRLPISAENAGQLPVLTVGEKSQDPTAATETMLKTLAALPEALRERAREMTASSRDDVSFIVESESHGRKRVVWGNAKDGELKARVLAALLEVDAPVIDVSSPTAPVTREK
ncbi:FtsQ-type POTRA domain-containing protein [Dermabacteraceae bacterium TAE3-ERU27]|nr:FtsQ-type POTRA domain-containing protein [Dermabacteraceae bacterium TAE3-ERU27]